MKKVFGKSCLIEIKVGDRVMNITRNMECIVQCIKLVPNGTIRTDPSLIAIIAANYVSGGRIIATADKFKAISDVEYEESYPSDLLNIERK